MKYRAKVEAKPGALLLGGVKVHFSDTYPSAAQAARLAATFAEVNFDAGRKVAHASVQRLVSGDVPRRRGKAWVHHADVDFRGWDGRA